ncbi:hypothetical protein CBW65_06490 [Tumebacillus avium]|uniref:DUF2975 domain-containing protein n=1 Tax=Tumebacillus avium TaxID=1903704 RepID=A0A1Y0IWG4_9BACL|nr:DUF2975 domain-containing protein [Tumebacillus avium]ARU63815.1 hypothetical protein CBW65_06490 [Tumebacillus avium]
MGIPVLAFCIMPWFAADVTATGTEMEYLKYVLVVVYITAIVFFGALYQAFKLLTYIDKNKAFSELSVKALQNIKRCALTIGGLYVVCMPFLFPMAQADDAPGLVGIPLVITFASIAVAVVAAVLQKLLKHAIDIKSENDLTV